ncbi:lysophospholipid acyltransferase family protein [Allostreptomyces psammosilenae]|uniref:1-acyl-sn-glycerol-3-phosphate acyltransferase n=1 Tax=Allostreptomyces psammosilenae TaxID=1892865 RepID=A0A852ZZD2_9ACTN|nr:lysophospholipid acyltransferase family protein [Allostreptomyces psammosilenae]NYI06580.1 1-acyl-sn-glycerol-3-phosphate acyltransferase [Allostreptomyces psammosilenae]
MARSPYGFWYRFVAAVLKPPLLLLTKREWQGMEHIPAEGGFVTAVNHNSYLDPVAYAHFQYNTGRPPRFLAKSSLFHIAGVGTVLRGMKQIPVYRDSADAAKAFRAAVDAVGRGECVAVYPEGTLTRDPDLWPMAGKTGVARIALMTGAPVIPVAQWGAHQVVPRWIRGAAGPEGKFRVRLFPRATLRVLAGPPVDLSEFRDRELNADVLRAATDRIMDAVTELLAELRGEEPPGVRFDMRASGAATRAQLSGEPAGRPDAPATNQASTASDAPLAPEAGLAPEKGSDDAGTPRAVHETDGEGISR